MGPRTKTAVVAARVVLRAYIYGMSICPIVRSHDAYPNEVPNHLHQKITNDPTLARQLGNYHSNLSANKKGKLLNLCVWQSVYDGHILDCPEEGNSITQNLDIFQRELAK